MIAAISARKSTSRTLRILVGLLSLLTFTTSAYAECAWVLWLNHTGVVAGEELAMCPEWQQVLAATRQANNRAVNSGDAVTLRGSNMIDIVSAAGPHTLLYVCLPDTVDPRGRRGSESGGLVVESRSGLATD